jgi:dolichol-phosphate mannosyltransferase
MARKRIRSASSPDKIAIVMPTYNERENLEQIVGRVLDLGPAYHVLVVDDNSPDGTGELADSLAERDPRVTVLHRPGKLGLGTAYIEGFEKALAGGATLVGQMDADGSHDPRYLPDLVSAAEEADLVVGSRYVTGVNAVDWEFRRIFLSKLANLFVTWVTGMPIRDATAGFVFYRDSTLETIDFGTVRSRGYAFQVEMKYRAWAAGLRVREHSIVFFGRRWGGSKLDRATVREAFWLVLRIACRERMLRLRRLLGRLFRRQPAETAVERGAVSRSGNGADGPAHLPRQGGPTVPRVPEPGGTQAP